MNPSGRSIVLIGSALTPEMAARHRDVSAAAAKWQMDIASALASDFATTVRCISFVPVATGERTASDTSANTGHVEVIPVYWRRGVGGFGRYALSIVGKILAVRRDCSAVFCYNPSPWTAPWAMLLAMLSRSHMVMIVADVAPESGTPRQKVLAKIERILLTSGNRFLLVSEATRALLPQGTRGEIFAGLPDAAALNAPLPVHSGSTRFVFSGSLAEYGGVQVFLNAAAQVANDADCEFHIFGKGALALEIPENLKSRLQVHGFVSDAELNEFLGANCVGVNPRIDPNGINRYNAPYKLLYYLARGLPTITTVTPGVSRALADACVVADEGVDGLVKAMRVVLEMSPAQRADMGRRGREVVAKEQNAAVLRAKIGRLLA